MASPTSLGDRVQRLANAQAGMKALLADPDHWTNNCETVFAEFRQAAVHLKKEQQVLDDVEDKETICTFMAKFCRDRPPFQKRSEEVLKILLGSEAFKQAFRKAGIEALPPGVRDIVQDGAEPAAPLPAAAADVGGAGGKTSMVVVVERCTEAKLRIDAEADGWDSIQQGLVIRVSLVAGAPESLAASVARSLLAAKLSAASEAAERDAAESVAELCRQGHAQGILVVPQTLLIAQLRPKDSQLSYPSLEAEDNRGRLYDVFVRSLCSAASEVAQPPKIVAGRYGDPQSWEIKSGGFMHSFNY